MPANAIPPEVEDGGGQCWRLPFRPSARQTARLLALCSSLVTTELTLLMSQMDVIADLCARLGEL